VRFELAGLEEPTMTAQLDRKPEEMDYDKKQRREEKQLDKELQDSFPASDPPAITQPTPTPQADDKQKKGTKRRSHG
jgi:hypothetical protein